MAASSLKSVMEFLLAVIRIFVFIFYNYFVSPLLFPCPEIDAESKTLAKDSSVYN